MEQPPLAQLETTNRVRKRAQYEAFEFSIHADSGGVLVRNGSYADPENHEYLVAVTNGLPTDCECPANVKFEGACKHRVAVAIRRPILDALTEVEKHQQAKSKILADGGLQASTAESKASEATDDSDDCTCADLSGEFPCWECYRTGRRDFPEE